MAKQTFGDIIYNYCLEADIKELYTDYIELLHDMYCEYEKSDCFRLLKINHPLNKLRAVRNCLKRDKRFKQDGWFNSKWGRISHYIVLKNL